MFRVVFDKDWTMNAEMPTPQPDSRTPEVAEPAEERKPGAELEGPEEEAGYGYGV